MVLCLVCVLLAVCVWLDGFLCFLAFVFGFCVSCGWCCGLVCLTACFRGLGGLVVCGFFGCDFVILRCELCAFAVLGLCCDF